MPLERLWLLGTARAERGALGRTIQYTEPDAWDLDSVSAGWRNRDIVAHLASTEVAAAAAVAGETPTEIEEFVKAHQTDRLDVDAFNAAAVERRANEPFRAVCWDRTTPRTGLWFMQSRNPPGCDMRSHDTFSTGKFPDWLTAGFEPFPIT